jgi:NADPH:quinone reductase-like Zn-dependent oxidoreductase
MKAVRLHAYGDVDQFKLDEVPAPSPGEGEVLVKIEASGLNPFDLWLRQGYAKDYYPIELPAILGRDAAGTVVAVGPGVSGFTPGDRVIASLPLGRGAAAELAVAPVTDIAKLPADVSFAAGATLPLVGLTARHAVNALGVKSGDRVLVSGALGAVGRAAVQALKELGAVPVAGVRAERLEEGKALAGEAVDVNTTPALPTFDFAISTAPAAAGNVLAFVKDGGKVASAVQTPAEANPGNRVEIIQAMGRNDPAVLQQVADAAGRGELTVPVARTFRLAELGAAHRALAAGPRGKIVLEHF